MNKMKHGYHYWNEEELDITETDHERAKQYIEKANEIDPDSAEAREKMNLNKEIIQSIPRVCPIESIENYNHNSEEWEYYIDEINYKINDFNSNFIMAGTEKWGDDAWEEMRSRRIGKYKDECIIINASFGDLNNKYLEIEKINMDELRLFATKGDSGQSLIDRSEEVYSVLHQIVNPAKCHIIQDNDLYQLSKDLDEKEFLHRFNNSLFEYAKRKLALEKKNDLDTSNSQWERSVRELVHWFSDYNFKPTKKKDTGRPKGRTKRTIDRYKKVYHRFIISQKKFPAKKKSELYELCSTKDYNGMTYSRKTIKNIIEDKRYNLIPSR